MGEGACVCSVSYVHMCVCGVFTDVSAHVCGCGGYVLACGICSRMHVRVELYLLIQPKPQLRLLMLCSNKTIWRLTDSFEALDTARSSPAFPSAVSDEL